MQTSHQNLIPAQLLTAAVNNVFQSWQAFTIGTSMGKHSNEKSKWIIQVTETCLYENRDVDDGVELGDWIGDILDQEFDLVIEDGSLQEVGTQLITYWKMYQNQQFTELADLLDKRVAEMPVMSLPPRLEPGSSSSDESSDDEKMDVETSEPQPGPSQAWSSVRKNDSGPGPDADGWVTVKKNKKR